MKNNAKQKLQALKKKDQPVTEEEEEKKQQSDENSNQYLASASRDKTIKLWDVKGGRCVFTLKGHDNWVTSVVFHPNGKYLFSTSDDKSKHNLSQLIVFQVLGSGIYQMEGAIGR